jgi:hypothetical protein
MDLQVVSRLAAAAQKMAELDVTIAMARRAATPEQLAPLKEIEQSNKCRIAVSQREGTADFEGRVDEALRVLDALLSLKNKKATRANYTHRSLKNNGYIEALRRTCGEPLLNATHQVSGYSLDFIG